MEEEEEAGRESFDRFMKWAAELGITDSPHTSPSPNNPIPCLSHSLVVSNFPDGGGRGLAAARHLTKGELVLTVPKSALFTTNRLLADDPKLSSAVNDHPSLSPTQMLGVCLLYEMGKGRKSWWYPYLKQLPRGYDTLATFSEFQKQTLQVQFFSIPSFVDDAIWTAEKAIQTAKMEWTQAKPLMEQLCFKPKFLSFKAWTWVSATISSRTMHVSWDEAGTLCPVGDFFNYAAPGEESFIQDNSVPNEIVSDQLTTEKINSLCDASVDAGFSSRLSAYCFYARRDYTKGEQVLLAYGTYTNLDLLEHYGFLLGKNPNDKAFIPLEPCMHSLTSWPQDSMYIHVDGKPSFALLCALRFYVSPVHQRRSIAQLVYSGLQVSEENEMSAMRWLSKKCDELLQTLPTTMEEDDTLMSVVGRIENTDCPVEVGKLVCSLRGEGEDGIGELLQSSRRTKNALGKWKLAVQWRHGYKKILSDCICYCNQMIKELSLLEN
ncbi:Protein SET DOMAIN GROUP 40 [Linum grandiflorum]